MKKLIVFILAAVMLLVLAACGNESADTTDNDISGSGNRPEQTKPENGTKPNQDEEAKPVDPSSWGVVDQFAADNDKPSESFYINFPHYAGASKAYALLSDQSDGTVALVSGQNDYAPDVDNLSELFPAYFEQLQYTLEKYYGLRAKNFSISLAGDHAAQVGGYDMHRFSGQIAFEYEGNPREYKFIAYATALKSNGAYAYWVVYDNTADQSNGDLIAQHALNMAQTFHE